MSCTCCSQSDSEKAEHIYIKATMTADESIELDTNENTKTSYYGIKNT